MTKEKAKKEQAFKKGAGYKKGRTILKKGEKKRKVRAIKKRKAPWGAYLKGFRQSRCRMIYDRMNKAYFTLINTTNPCKAFMISGLDLPVKSIPVGNSMFS